MCFKDTFDDIVLYVVYKRRLSGSVFPVFRRLELKGSLSPTVSVGSVRAASRRAGVCGV